MSQIAQPITIRNTTFKNRIIKGAMSEALANYEGQPNVLLEAQSCGCPPIAFDCDYGPSYLILNGKTGLVIPYADENAMAKAIVNFLNHPEMKQEFRKNMPEHLKQFAPEQIYPQWEELIKQIMEKQK